ncbi:MAG: hypothetical protein A2W33_10030 [Chloroflexi bacterium RBG_16_52_11]|nr:MAG: hypothetical protein A2W33_10030 [Chloroflexi bacterium RBG_16_52_11]
MSSDFLVQLLGFVGGLAVLIIVHELGHFVAARAFKVGVDEFGIGFPPRLVKLFNAGGTLFSINWIPLGGFVRLRGEGDPSVPGGMAAANPWVRIAVLFAGPFTNLALGAILAVFFIYSLGEPVPGKVQIQQVVPGSPAESAGLQVNDFIVKVNDLDVADADKLHEEIYANLGKPVKLTIQRGERNLEVTLVPRDPPPEDGAIGIMMGYATQPTTWVSAIPGGVRLAADYGKSVFALPFRILQGEVSPAEGRPIGYKGMIDVYVQIRNPLWFFMVISLSLGIFNLLPIPALDGGRILFVLTEIVFHRRVPPQYENVIHLVGFTMLIILMIYINLLDFINPVQLPK